MPAGATRAVSPAKRAAATISVLVLAALFFAIKQPLHAAPATDSAPASTVSPGDAKECPPTQLTIPDLGVNAAIVPVGAERDGTLGTPSDKDKDKAGWYPSVLVGAEHGTIILDAHTYHDDSAVLKTSFPQQAHVGMTIGLQCADGRSRSYAAAEVKSDLTVQAYPAFVQNRGLYAPDGPPQLILVTCTDWNPTRRDWDTRAVIIATPTP